MFQLPADHTPQPPWESLFQGTGEENSVDGWTSDSGGTMRFSSGLRNTGPALYPPQGARGFMGVCRTSSHVVCGLGESIQPCPSWHTVGGAPGVQGWRPSTKCWAALCHRFCSVFLWTEFLGAATGRRGSGYRRWYGLVGFFEPGPPACPGAVCSRVWSSWDENQHIQVRGHGSRPEKGGFSRVPFNLTTSNI